MAKKTAKSQGGYSLRINGNQFNDFDGTKGSLSKKFEVMIKVVSETEGKISKIPASKRIQSKKNSYIQKQKNSRITSRKSIQSSKYINSSDSSENEEMDESDSESDPLVGLALQENLKSRTINCLRQYKNVEELSIIFKLSDLIQSIEDRPEKTIKQFIDMINCLCLEIKKLSSEHEVHDKLKVISIFITEYYEILSKYSNRIRDLIDQINTLWDDLTSNSKSLSKAIFEESESKWLRFANQIDSN